MLDTDLFAANDRPFGAYLEPKGYAALCEMRKPNVRTYERLLPRTVELAQAVWSHTPQRDVWGRQIAPRQWITFTDGRKVEQKVRGGTRTVVQQALRVQDLTKHLLGRTHAVGTSDAPRINEVWDPQTHEFREVPTRVRCLRLDVDQDKAWANRDATAIFNELYEQRLIAHGLGLPYHAFRTGDRGFQAVLALPASVPHPLASFLLESYRSLLELRGTERAHLDADNLHKLMRLPGGTHARNYHLGLWIDLEQQQLHRLEEQMRLMTAAFCYPHNCLGSFWKSKGFATAATDLLAGMRNLGVRSGTLLSREQVKTILQDQPENPLIRRWQQARELALSMRAPQMAVSSPTSPARDSAIPTTKPTPTIPGSEEPNQPQREPCRSSSEWAVQVCLDLFEPGGFWDWLNTGGRNGILAAHILFGQEGAEQHLRRIAEEVPVRSPADLQDRHRTITGCLRTFSQKDFQAPERAIGSSQPLPLGEVTSEIESLTESIAMTMRQRDPKGRWKDSLAYQLVLVLLLALRDSPNGCVAVSYRTLAATINEMWPAQSKTNRTRVQEMLQRLIPGERCLYEMLHRTPGKAAIGEPDRYHPGLELGRTPLGRVWMRRKQMEGQDASIFISDEDDLVPAGKASSAWDGGQE